MLIKTKPPRIILAIDPGYDRCGWAVGTVSKRNLNQLHYGLISTNKRNHITARLKQINDQILELIEIYHPAELAMESLVVGRNAPTIVKVAEVRGILQALAFRYSMQIAEYNPGTIKVAVTGHGKATKANMTKMVRLQLKLDDKPIIDDTIDALGVLLCHAVST